MILPQMMMYINIIKIQDIVTENEDFIETNNQIKQTEIPKKRKVKSLNKIKINLQNYHLLNQKKKEKIQKTNYMNLNNIENFCNEEKNNLLVVNYSIKNFSLLLSLKNCNKIDKSIHKNLKNNKNIEENISQNNELFNLKSNF